MKKQTPKPPKKQMAGVILLEALISVVIVATGILAIIGLQGTAKKIAVDAKFRTDASFIASQTISQMWADWDHIPDYAGSGHPTTDHTLPASDVLPGGSRTITIAGDSTTGYVATVTVGWTLPGADSHKHVAMASIHN